VEWPHADVQCDGLVTVLGSTPWLVVQLLILLGALVVAGIALVRAVRRR